MLRSMKSMTGLKIHARDGIVGDVFEFYFDDQSWTIRFLVVDTGKWLPGRRVLISPHAAGTPDWEKNELPVSLNKQQVEESPDISTEKPVSRQNEMDIFRHYGWPIYWDNDMSYVPAANYIGAQPDLVNDIRNNDAKSTQIRKDPHLRSSREVTGYSIQASDGEIGHVEDFIVDDSNWMIRYMVVETRKWLPGGRKMIIAPYWVKNIDWASSKVEVEMNKESINNSPEYDESKTVNREYESLLHDYYGKNKYWEAGRDI